MNVKVKTFVLDFESISRYDWWKRSEALIFGVDTHLRFSSLSAMEQLLCIGVVLDILLVLAEASIVGEKTGCALSVISD